MGKDKITGTAPLNQKGLVVSHKPKSASGKFIGDAAAVHIHTEGSRYHVKFGTSDKTRMNFNPGNASEVQSAYDYLQEKWKSSHSGYKACEDWFKKKGAK
jgi:hypothetical protein